MGGRGRQIAKNRAPQPGLSAAKAGGGVAVPTAERTPPGGPPVPPSNTYPSFRQENGCGGADWLGVSCFVDWDLERFKWNITELEKLKRKNQVAKGGVSAADDGMFWCEEAKKRFRVHRTGVRHTGGDEGGVYFDFNIECDGVQYHLTRRPTSAGIQPNVYVKVGSCPLMEHGHARMWWHAVGMLKCLGATIDRAILSRIDLCADLAGVDVAPYVRSMEKAHVIRKALKWRPYYYGVDGTTGFECGSELKLRVYDKLQETEHDPIKRELLTRLRWGGALPEAATRVEFRVGRNTMREHSIGYIEDAFDKLPQLTRWLTHDWFRMVGGFDRRNRHHDRAWTHKRWREVQDRFAWVGQGGGELVKRTSRPDPEKLLLAVWGNLSSAACLEGRLIQDREALAEYIAEKVRAVDVERLSEAQERKFSKMESQLPDLAPIPTDPRKERMRVHDHQIGRSHVRPVA